MQFTIGLVAPYRRLIEEAAILFQKHNVPLIAKFAYLENAVLAAREMESEGVEVIIVREGTDMYIKGQINIPVVPIPVSSTDILHAYVRAREISDKIVLANFKDRYKDIDILTKAVNCPILVFSFNDEKEARQKMEEYAGKAEVLIGGGMTTALAQEFGLKTVLIETRMETIGYAMEFACNIAKSRWEEKKKYNEISTIIKQSAEGLVAVDKNENITVFNPKAEKMFRVSSGEIGEKTKEHILRVTGLSEILAASNAINDRIVEIYDKKTLISTVPIFINKKICGGVCTLQDIHRVQQIEHDIRINLHPKGLRAKANFNDIIGKSNIMNEVVAKAKKYAGSEFTILITGETGTGKELFAQSIHNFSRRKNGPFVAINCAAIPSSLLEAELFGYVEGSFTGAKKGGKPGLFELAHNGTIFLDEIGDIPMELQARLLRVIQEKEVIKVGGDKIIPINVRIIAATNLRLSNKVAQGTFREDLYYRLNVLHLEIPPLRERSEDIPVIAAHILKKYRVKSEDIEIMVAALATLKNFDWKGNVRELENLLANLTVLLGNKSISYDLVLKEIARQNLSFFNKNKRENMSYKSAGMKRQPVKEEVLEELLNDKNLSRIELAARLGVSRTTLWRKLKDYKNKSPLN